MTDNIFKVLGIQTREDCISNALAYAINNSKEIQDFFLSKICNTSSNFDTCKAYTRISTGESGIPDLVLLCDSPEKKELIVIENKLKADEGKDQTDRYASDDSIRALHQKLCPQVSGENVNTKFIFLTLFPDQQPSSSKFITRKHEDLLPLLQKVSIGDLAGQLLNDWLSLVDSFYKKSKVDDQDMIYEKLQDRDGLDGGYLYFRTFLSNLTLPENIQNEDYFRDSRQGRHYYGARFSKDRWHPSEMTENNGQWTLDPEKVFNIHFEPQFNVLNGVFNIFLHYEVNPYVPAAWIRKNIPNEQFTKYMDRREKFIRLLNQVGLKQWAFGGGSNQIAKVQLDFRHHSVKNALDEIGQIFQEALRTIDSILEKL